MRALVLVLFAGCQPLLDPPRDTETVWFELGDVRLVYHETITETLPDASIDYTLRLDTERGSRVILTGFYED